VELLVDSLVLLGVLKVVGAAILVVMGLPFIVGIVLGYVIGHRV
jgi:hypothetical protein